ncbi:MAG: spore germination protein [Firmicutes bacterium]|nr:spore germination protein [Bacillota bacterium]
MSVSTENQTLSGSFAQDSRALDRALQIGKSFDLVTKPVVIGERKGKFYLVDGFAKDDLLEKVMQFLFSVKPEDLAPLKSAQDFADRFVPYTETEIVSSAGDVVTQVLSGTIALILDGFAGAVMIDARTYPARSVGEPDDDRVLRGAHDGFVETLVMNTALIRRRLRDPRLTMHYVRATDVSRADVVLCYLDGAADERTVQQLIKKIEAIRAKTLTMGQESLAETLIPRQWFNPFPRIRYTERPDTAAACAAEGKILILTDNSPSVMILPVTLFDFVQDTNDFYFPPAVGSYLRLLRITVFLLTLFLTPVWFLLVENPQWIPEWLAFIRVEEPNTVPIAAQLLIIEFMLDALKIASLNTPSALSTSFSVVSALILGDFAIQAGWLVPEVVLYMAFVATGNFTQPSFELGYAFKFSRVVMIVLTAIFSVWGFCAAIALLLLTIACTRTVTGGSYLAPLIPFSAARFAKIFFRGPISRKNT